MTSVISFTRQLKSGPKQYSYNFIGGVATPEYLRRYKRTQYRAKKASNGHTVAKGVIELTNEADLVDTIRHARERNESYRAIGREFDISRYKVQRICELHAIP